MSAVYDVQSPTTPKWQDEYMRGTGMEMYTECLSAAFVGLSFPAAAQYVLSAFSAYSHPMRLSRCAVAQRVGCRTNPNPNPMGVGLSTGSAPGGGTAV